MNKFFTSKGILLSSLFIIAVVAGFLWHYIYGIKIQKITLTSPHNYAFQEDIEVELNTPATVYVRYWKKGSGEHFRTVNSKISSKHTLHLLLLETDSEYEYQVVIDRFIKVSSKTLAFHTRKQSPWLVHNWIKEEKPHDASALGNGMILLCYARLPGYIAMVDGTGKIRWYWQADDIGVRAATITPRGTIIAMLRPPKKDIVDDTPKTPGEISKEEQKKPMRRGALGFAGGTAIAEIDLTGKTLWRLDLSKEKEKKYQIIHHDIRMDKNHHIYTLFRDPKPYDMRQVGGVGLDTLVGDGIVVMDTTGKVLRNWSAWKEWDIKNDPYITRFAYDRFHMNALNFDKDGNYLVSVSIEDQIWKINAKTGKIMWKLGKNGDFKMDSSAYFSFQHSVNINSDGDLMLFDNSLVKNQSRGLSFSLDTVNMVATTKIDAPLPKSKYTSRMGNSYLLPNRNLLQVSSKTGAVFVTDLKGEILWELDSYFVPYRAEYVPGEVWSKYFMKD